MYKLYSTGLYRFTFVLNAWPVDERTLSADLLHRSPRRHIDATNHSTAFVGVDIFGVQVSAQFRLADQTTGERCPSGLSLQRFDQHVKRHIPMGTIF